jgi:hypothetical protein
VNGNANAHDGRSPEAIVGEGLTEEKRESDGRRRVVSDRGHGSQNRQIGPTAPAV